MPAIDLCEPQMIRAFQKAGWVAINQPYLIRYGSKRDYVFADLRLQHVESEQQMVIVEVKCFPPNRPYLDELYASIGQYLFYETLLSQNNGQIPLYLAVPASIYQTFLQKSVIQTYLRKFAIKLVVVDLVREEILTWVN